MAATDAGKSPQTIFDVIWKSLCQNEQYYADPGVRIAHQVMKHAHRLTERRKTSKLELARARVEALPFPCNAFLGEFWKNELISLHKKGRSRLGPKSYFPLIHYRFKLLSLNHVGL